MIIKIHALFHFVEYKTKKTHTLSRNVEENENHLQYTVNFKG